MSLGSGLFAFVVVRTLHTAYMHIQKAGNLGSHQCQESEKDTDRNAHSRLSVRPSVIACYRLLQLHRTGTGNDGVR